MSASLLVVSDGAAVGLAMSEKMHDEPRRSVFVEMMGEQPTLSELEAFGLFSETKDLLEAYALERGIVLPPPAVNPTPLISFASRPPAERNHTSTASSRRPSLRPPKPSRPLSTSLIPIQTTSSSLLPSSRPAFQNASSASAVPQLFARRTSLDDGGGLAQPKQRKVPTGSGSSRSDVAVVEVRQARKLKKSRPSTPGSPHAQQPAFATTLSAEPDTIHISLSPTSLHPLSPPPFERRRSWRASLSPSPAATPSRPNSPLASSFPRAPSPLTSFPGSAPREGPLPPIEKRNSRNSTFPSDESYHGDEEGPSRRGSGAASPTTTTWVSGLAGRLGLATKKSVRKTDTSGSDSSNGWEVVSSQGGSSSSKGSFEVLHRPVMERARSSERKKSRASSGEHDSMDEQGQTLSPPPLSPNLGKIDEESGSLKRSAKIMSLVSASAEASPCTTPLGSPTTELNPASLHQALENSQSEAEKTATPSLLTATRPALDQPLPSPPPAPKPFLTVRDPSFVSSDEDELHITLSRQISRSAPTRQSSSTQSSSYTPRTPDLIPSRLPSSSPTRRRPLNRSRSSSDLRTRSDSEDFSYGSTSSTTFSDGEETGATVEYSGKTSPPA
ncbi:hypothetical protein MNV49_005276 [Pseudohyphozyma bogoriensis]|nr:hypothetical protein MNV49_005276 [Pseudohyphozyma bogoriensis]